VCLLGAAAPAPAFTVQEAILRAKPAVALVTAEVKAEVTMNCGDGPVTVSPPPFRETGTGWFVDGRGYLITNGHVVDPAYTMPRWVTHELKKKAIDQACVDPILKKRGVARGERPDIEDQIRRDASDRALATAKITPTGQVTVLLSNGKKLPAQVVKFSPPISFDASNQPLKGSGRDLALLRVADGVYPALTPAGRDPRIGDPVHILGYPGVVLTHELLDQSVVREAVVTNGAVSGFDKDLIGQDVIQSDASAAHGNSGGPAIGNDSRVVGVMTFTTMSAQGGAIVQGFNFLIPARDVLKFLQGSEVTAPGSSKFNDAWIAGLSGLFGENYKAAAASLAEANRLLPDLPDVKRSLEEANEKVRNPPPRPFPWIWVAIGVTMVSVGVYGGMLFRRWWQNRYRILPGQVIGLIERGLSPVLVDARTQADFEASPLILPQAVRISPEDAEAGKFQLQVEPRHPIVTYCATAGELTSARIAARLRQRGYRDVRILKGGLGSWTNAGLPVEAKSSMPSIGVEIYKNLTVGDLERRKFSPGQVIIEDGAEAHGEAFVVHSGKIEIRKTLNGVDRVLAVLGEGELLGDMALFRKAPRSASAVSMTDVELLVLKNDRLEWLIRNRPQVTFELLRRLSEMAVQRERAELEAR
jgi:S1-C subfamily serine protease/rhodanese-related sulfurtransferase